ncbi:MAG: 30S ribosomal protein S6 [Alphaproteobacteria bacterium]|nr:30S ribosomal protein S6 [Alphaproteobacteria bacterium]
MSFYEHVFVTRQDLTPAQVDELTDKFAGVIEKEGGKVTKRENWGLRNLAYRIQKNRKGYYVLLNIDAPAVAVQELERVMRIDEDVIRHLTVKVEALEEGPSVMLAPKANKKADDVDDLFNMENESEAF